MKIKLALIILANVFCIAETWYFGWNWTPKSPAKKCCDMFSLCLIVAGFIFLIRGKT